MAFLGDGTSTEERGRRALRLSAGGAGEPSAQRPTRTATSPATSADGIPPRDFPYGDDSVQAELVEVKPLQGDVLFPSEAIHAAERIVNLIEGATAEALQADERTLDAVLWNFTVLGEEVKHFGQNEHFRAMAWRKPIAMRDRVVHGCWSADLQILLDTLRATCRP